MDERLEALERLARLRETGALTEAEFQGEKARIIGPASPPVSGGDRRGRAQPARVGPATLIGAGVLVVGVVAGIWASWPAAAPQHQAGRRAAAKSPAPETPPSSTVGELQTNIAGSATPAPDYPQYPHAIPRAFRGAWGDADGCDEREPRFSLGSTSLANLDDAWDVTRVKIDGPDAIEVSAAGRTEEGDQVGSSWRFRLVDNGRALAAGGEGGKIMRRCPSN